MRVFALESDSEPEIAPDEWAFTQHWPDLVDLSLCICSEPARGTLPLLSHVHSDAQLTRLSLTHACDLRAVPGKRAEVVATAQALARHTRLAALYLSWCSVDVVAAKVLARRAFTALRQLSALSLQHDHVDDGAAGVIARCVCRAPLARLVMSSSTPNDKLTARGVGKVLAQLGGGAVPFHMTIGSAWFEAHRGARRRLQAAAPANVFLDFGRFIDE